jgi:transglutaminase-like putative cysteine protease
VVEKFADALKEIYQSIADRSVSAQESVNANMDFLNSMFSYSTDNAGEVQDVANK